MSLHRHLGPVRAPGDRHHGKAEEDRNREVETASDPPVFLLEMLLLADLLHTRDPSADRPCVKVAA